MLRVPALQHALVNLSLSEIWSLTVCVWGVFFSEALQMRRR